MTHRAKIFTRPRQAKTLNCSGGKCCDEYELLYLANKESVTPNVGGGQHLWGNSGIFAMTLAYVAREKLQKASARPHARNEVCELRVTVTFKCAFCLLYLPNSNRTTRGTIPGPMAHAGAFTARRTAREVELVAQIPASTADVTGNMRTKSEKTILTLIANRSF